MLPITKIDYILNPKISMIDVMGHTTAKGDEMLIKI